MIDMILIYITCESEAQAKKIGMSLLQKHLSACIKIIPETYAAYFWPSESGRIVETTESVLLVKTIQERYSEIETVVRKHHSDKTPCILALPIAQVNPDYYEWLKGELDQ